MSAESLDRQDLIREVNELRQRVKELEKDELRRQDADDRVVRRSVELAKVNVELRNEVLERRKTQLEMASLARKIGFILGATRVGLDIIDSGFNIIYIDQEWQKIYGDYLGRKCHEYFMGREEICPNCGAVKAFETKKPVITEEVLPKEGGRPIQVTGIPFQDEKGEWLVAKVKVDISDRKKQEKQYGTILQTSIDGYWLVDARGNITEVNDAYCKMTGYSRTELLTMNISDLEIIEDKEVTLKHIQKIKKEGGDRFETKHRCKDGSIIDVEISVTYLEVLDQMFTFLRNITRRKALEKEISFKNTILQAQLDTSLDGILIVDNSGKTLLYNIRFGSMWKIPRKLLDFKDDDTMLRHVLSQLKDPDGFVSKVESLYKVKNARSKDLIEFKDGRFFERYSSPLKDASGQYFGRIWYFHDVTELKKDEESIKLSEEKFKLLYESSRDAIMQLDPKKGFIGGNAATIKMFKCRSESEFIKRGPADLSPKRQEDGTLSTVKAQKMIRIAMEKGSNFFDWTHKRMDGNVFPATVLLTRMQLKGKIFLQATVRDVSESKKTETKLKISELSLREENVILEEENLALKRVLVNFKKGNKRVPKTAAKKDQK